MPNVNAAEETTQTTAHGPVCEREASRLTGFSESYLRQARMRNQGPAFIRVNRAVRYRVDDLERWLNNHRIETRDVRGNR